MRHCRSTVMFKTYSEPIKKQNLGVDDSSWDSEVLHTTGSLTSAKNRFVQSLIVGKIGVAFRTSCKSNTIRVPQTLRLFKNAHLSRII